MPKRRKIALKVILALIVLVILVMYWFPRTFETIIRDEVVAIEGRHNGSGLYYKTEDPELINKFIEATQQMSFHYTMNYLPTAGSSGWRLTTKNGKQVNFSQQLTSIFTINGVRYKVYSYEEGKMKEFFTAFLTEANVIKGR